MSVDPDLRRRIKDTEGAVSKINRSIESMKQEIGLLERRTPVDDRDKAKIKDQIKERSRQVARLKLDLKTNERHLGDLKRMAR